MELWLTGAGMVTSVGTNKWDCFSAFCRGQSGVAPLRAFDSERFNTKHAYEIEDRHCGEVPLRATGWLCGAIEEAIADAALMPQQEGLRVYVGTGLRELRSLELFHSDGTPLQADQLHFGTAVRERVPFASNVYTISNACAASSYALALAEDAIRLGQANAVVAAGCDSITESMFGLLDRVNPEIPERLQVFDRNRKGVLMGEGAAAVVVESAAHARARGARFLARLLSVGVSCDAAHETAPDQDGILRAIHDGHRRAGVRPEDIDIVFVHGTGTSLNDTTEGAALAAAFPADSRRPLLSGLKSMTGHTSGASGLVGVVTAALTLQSKRVPPTVGLEQPIPEVAGLAIATEVVDDPRLRYAQINAFGFGGVNSVVLLEGVGA